MSISNQPFYNLLFDNCDMLHLETLLVTFPDGIYLAICPADERNALISVEVVNGDFEQAAITAIDELKSFGVVIT